MRSSRQERVEHILTHYGTLYDEYGGRPVLIRNLITDLCHALIEMGVRPSQTIESAYTVFLDEIEEQLKNVN